MFELTQDEFENLRSQFGTSSWGGVIHFPVNPEKSGRYIEHIAAHNKYRHFFILNDLA